MKKILDIQFMCIYNFGQKLIINFNGNYFILISRVIIGQILIICHYMFDPASTMLFLHPSICDLYD